MDTSINGDFHRSAHAIITIEVPYSSALDPIPIPRPHPLQYSEPPRSPLSLSLALSSLPSQIPSGPPQRSLKTRTLPQRDPLAPPPPQSQALC